MPPDISAFDTSLFDFGSDADVTLGNSAAMSPDIRAAAALNSAPLPHHTASSSVSSAPSATPPVALSTDPAKAASASVSVAAPETLSQVQRIGALNQTRSFVVHSKKQSLVLQAVASLPSPHTPTPSSSTPLPVASQTSPLLSTSPHQHSPDSPSIQSTQLPRKKSAGKRGSVFTVAAVEIMQQNPEIFKFGQVKEEDSEAAAAQEHVATESAPEEAEQEDTELDWSPGSEFVKFASITTLPSLKIPEIPAITDEFMETLTHYKKDFADSTFNTSGNRNRNRSMRIFTGRQFVEYAPHLTMKLFSRNDNMAPTGTVSATPAAQSCV